MTLGLDYSGGRPRGSAVKAAGFDFVARYLANGLAGGRVNLTDTEAADMERNGVEVVLVWERKIIGQPDRATEGRGAGIADAQAALTQAAAVGRPDQPIYFCVDFDIPDYAPGNADARTKLGPVGDYLAAARDIVGQSRMGVYGGYWAVSRALDAGIARYAWQTAAWSGTHEDPRIHLFQRVGFVHVDGVECDVDEARQADYGQHSGGSSSMDEQSIARAVWEMMIRPNGLVNSSGQQVAYPAGDIIGYGDDFARQAKDAAVSAVSKIDALTAEVTDLKATVAELKAAQQPAISGTFSISGSGSVSTPTQGSGN